MERSLSASDATTLLEFVASCGELADLDTWRVAIIPGLQRLIPADAVSVEEIEISNGRRRLTVDPPELPLHLDEDAFFRNIAQHPIIAYQRETGDLTPIRFSDLVTASEWHRRELYQEHFRPLGFEHQLAATFIGHNHVFVGAAFQRSGRNFSARDRKVLTYLRPHLLQQYQTLQQRLQLTATLFALEHGEDMTGAAAVLGHRDTVSLATSEFTNIARRWFGVSPDASLPVEISSWLTQQRSARDPLPLRKNLAGAQLQVELFPPRRPGAPEVIVLREHRAHDDELRSALSARQLQVLELMATGLSDGEVAEALGVTRHTARRHAEHIYVRLGVRNRTEATARLLRR